MKPFRRLFVYGSLLRGEENHFALHAARFVVAARTAPRYTLADRGQYPALLDEGTTAVLGELYEVPEEALPHLDDFEGHPDMYARGPVELESGLVVEAYLMPRERVADFTVVSSGDWRAHRRAVAIKPGS